MITYTPDGKSILTANEGEPNSDYSIDPLGTVSIISVKENYAGGVLFISEKNSPIKRSLLVISSEGDGVIKVYSPKNL